MISDTRRVYLTGVVVLLALLAGCLGVTVEVTVDEDGLLDLDMEMEMDPLIYTAFEEEAHDDGYESVAEAIASDLEDEGWNIDEFGSEEGDDGDMVIWVTGSETDPASIETITVEMTEDEVTFEESDAFEDEMGGDLGEEFDVSGEELLDMIEFTYRLNMPGDIIDSNGDQIDDQTVEWRLEDHLGVATFEATSERGTDDASAIPGLGIAIGILALLVASMALFRNRD